MSSFWSIWIIIITLGSIFAYWWLLQSNSKSEAGADGEAPTTGHVYDGIEEYDNPLPRWWYIMFIVTIVFSLVYLALYPGLGTFKGFLGWSQEAAWEEETQKADEKYGPIFTAYAATSIEDLQSNKKALLSGQRIFANNCAVCHGSAATGSYGFPNLTDNDWLYGGDPANIKATILNGRKGAMPAWGAVLGEDGVNSVAEYVMSLSGRNVNQNLLAEGKTKYDATCAMCHGAAGEGNMALGAPNLSDSTWLYGGSPELIKHSIRNGRNGDMPAHKNVLGEDKVHLVAAYVYSLSTKN